MKKVLLLVMACLMVGGFGVNTFAEGFRDVPADAWYAKDLNEAVRRGLIKGAAEGLFAPDENITYAQFIAVLVREKFGEQPVVSEGFWADTYIRKAIEEKIVTSYNEIPEWEAEITRGKMAMFMCKALSISPDENLELLFADCQNPEQLDYYPYLTKVYKEYLLEGSGFGTEKNFFKKNTDHGSAVTRAQLATIIIRTSRYRENATAYKAERAKVREADFSARKDEYGKTIGLKYQSSSEHFDYYLNDEDVKAIPDLTKSLEENYTRITADLKTNFTEKVRVLIYPDIKTFHIASGQPNAQNWSVGTGGYNELKMVSPLNPGGVHTYNSLITVVVHEFTHTATWNITGKVGMIPKWLSEGLACYEAKQFGNGDISAIKLAISSNLTPSLSDLEMKDYSKINGYAMSYTVVDHMVKKYGMSKVIELVKTPSNFTEILGISKTDFEKQWIEYLKVTYK